MKRSALFVDRDGTLIVERHYINDPAGVELVSGAAGAIRQLNELHIPVVLVTNQSGIGRGLITQTQYNAVHERLLQLLAQNGAKLDAAYHCPHAPGDNGEQCNCRKPAPGMFLAAAKELDLDMSLSAYVGDRWRDIAAGIDAGGLGILVNGANTPQEEAVRASREAHVVKSFPEAVQLALKYLGGSE